ncbi:2-(1,2-epoxy-1,2-dihydrophenyl)acetyl-CoA isomerase PaaG [Bordetella bronchiseptica]|uniref:2-(1,2-epoxy-1,2-dihydrophenyl)acetyl-CoA isomerase PaaG n=1 Tax=Bordetella bronchiseptica TaxID=518 RepID=UPI00028B2C30|nr:2-(1,2-epoxy-1,2-dihydrophenyl)acetyl-CoA isomerase PaaG [Bordetella bronchiseptica]KCV31377.1 phenylacetate degradation enoyl-CoA hydratase PaaB [Bordetella bronchiseptica 00-P-2730]KDD60231.1 phenylacetate degradation enoyl-CoA hydratase PaaB [Bordetella bronchiseptica OSU553]AUL16427.1 2-(1,2-epoxy-1,2-dihydrophenyl)acetyl-CoA isomerase [Bordetella bronchiseptica]AWP59654.1 2-(1,2-epoxy-1,2-dihydrophenyl)acetyl-CoA isomerase [Bordetella bronchiseptica]AWQ06305.1 2-(1,2-epoxy-1,2-dihydrop
MTYQDILFELAGGVARLTLNRPDKLNSFTARMHGEVADALGRIEREGARVLVLTGAGRGFCAGQDLSERRPTADGAPPDLGETVEKFYGPLVRRLAALPLPVVVGVNGVAAGAGANLALAGDIVIARESASFIQSFCRLGLIPDTGGTFALPRLVGRARAAGLTLLGNKLSARQAQDWGLIWQCVADDEFDSALDGLAAHFAQAPTKGLAFTKRALQASLGNDLSTQLDLERDMMRELGRSADYAEGVAAFLDKREPQFKGK